MQRWAGADHTDLSFNTLRTHALYTQYPASHAGNQLKVFSAINLDTFENKYMRMGHLQGGIAADLLVPAMRERFEKLFSVAARKSVFEWRNAPHAQADVVLVDGSVHPDALGYVPTCMVCVGEPGSAVRSTSPWQARLTGNYTVADLIDVLDRAAVFLLDWQPRQKRQSPAIASAAIAPVRSAALYRLGSWVSMGAPFNTNECLRALALLAQGAVSARQISEHSGLEPVRTTALLNELQQRQVLVVSATAVVPAAPLRPHSAIARPEAGQSLVRRLSHWLKSASGQRA